MPSPEWHLIGTLQRNKVKYLTNRVKLIHSVDRLSLIKELDRQTRRNDYVQDILLQVMVVYEETKHGFDPKELDDAVRAVCRAPGLNLRGLMVMAPYVDDPEEVRPHFTCAAALFNEIKEKHGLEDFDTLSMGMSLDYRVAIECGSTLVRVGSAILGERDYK